MMTGSREYWANLIRELCSEQGMSQRRLAVLAGVNRSTLRRIMDGESWGFIRDWEAIFRVLGYELDIHVNPEYEAERDRAQREYQRRGSEQRQALRLRMRVKMREIQRQKKLNADPEHRFRQAMQDRTY